MDRQDEIVPPSTKKPVSVDGTLKIRTPSTKSPLFVDGGAIYTEMSPSKPPDQFLRVRILHQREPEPFLSKVLD